MIFEKFYKNIANIKSKLLSFLFIAFLLNIGNSYAQSSKIFVIANVDNQVITNLDLQSRYKFFIQTSNIKVSSKTEKLFILNKLVEKLIEEKLQLKNAQDSKISVSQEDLTKALDSIAVSQGAQNAKQIENYLKGKGVSYSEYVQQIVVQIIYKELVRKVIAPKVKVTQSDINEMIELQKINSKKTSLNLAEIFIPFSNKSEEQASQSLANKLVNEINKDNNFANIARQFSKSASKDLDGEIGWIEMLKLDPKISNELKNLKVNQISNPIKVNNGYYIFKIIDKKIDENLGGNEEEKIKNIIFNEKLKVEAKSYLANLKKSAYIRIDQEKIESSL